MTNREVGATSAGERGLKQFRQDACLSYAVFDRAAGIAAWIDADQAAIENYRIFLVEYRLRPVLALDTGSCPGHRPAAGLLRVEYGLEVAGAPSGRALADGERIDLGRLRLRAVDPRRLNPEFGSGTAILVESGGSHAEPAMAFLGVSVAIGTEAAARFEGLPAGTLLFPARAEGEILFSTLETENARHATGSPGLDDLARMSTAIAIEKYEQKIHRPKPGDAFIDVREASEFSESHIPGTRNIPISELGLHLSELRAYERVYVSCLSGRRSASAARTLAYVGLANVVNVIGGFQAWKGAGFPTESGIS